MFYLKKLTTNRNFDSKYGRNRERNKQKDNRFT